MKSTPTLTQRFASYAARVLLILLHPVTLGAGFVLLSAYIGGLLFGVKMAALMTIAHRSNEFIENNETIQQLHWSVRGVLYPATMLLTVLFLLDFSQYSLRFTTLHLGSILLLIPILWLRYHRQAKNNTPDEYEDKHAAKILNNND